MDNGNIKTLTRGAYDVQKLRIQMGNRIVGNFKAKLGQEPGQKEETMEAQEQRVLVTLRKHYDKLMDGLKDFPKQKKFKGDEVISTYTELCLLEQYMALEKQEKQHFKRLESTLNEYPVYTQYLSEVQGIGPALAGVIISELNVHEALYPSSFWAYAGLDVGHDGKGRSRRTEHLVERDYINKEGKPDKRVGITFNPFLKTKLIGVLGASFLRCGKENKYAKMYYDYKNRIENMPAHVEKSKGHRHNMAIRYMVKRFLCDLHIAWREIEGLPVTVEYSEGKLEMKHRA